MQQCVRRDRGGRQMYQPVSQILKQMAFSDGEWVVRLQDGQYISGGTLFEENNC